MKRFLLATILWLICAPAWAALSIEGANQGSTGSGTTCTVAITTSNSNDVIVVFSLSNGFGVSSVSGGGLTWHLRYNNTGANPIGEYYAVAASPLSAVTITVTYSGSSSYCVVTAFGISGADTTTIFDPSGSLPSYSATDPGSCTTTNAQDIIFAGFRTNSGSNSGSGWTAVLAYLNFQLVEYKIVSTTQSALSATLASPGASNGVICDAVALAGSLAAGPTARLRTLTGAGQ